MFGLDVRNLGVVTAAAAAVVASVYVLWGPVGRNRKSRKKDTCPGLVNLGNSCFLNAVLQAMASCSSVVTWLGELVDSQCRREKDYTLSLAYSLVQTLKILNNQGYEDEDTHCPTEVIDALRAKRWVISPDEQDAHELFHVFTESLDEEASVYPRVVSLFDLANLQLTRNVRNGPQQAVGRCREQLPTLPAKDGDLPLRGLLASQLQCKVCGYKCPVKYDKFDSLSLSIPSTSMGAYTLERLLKHFITSEIVQNVECEGCAKLAGQSQEKVPRATFIKRLTIGKLPQCLCVHIQRTVWLNSGVPMKRYEHIDFPETLHLDDYVYHKRQSHTQLPTSTNVDMALGLLGGRNGLNGFRSSGSRGRGATSPTVPYSRPLSLLKALNYHKRATLNGLYVQSQSDSQAEQASVQHLAQTFQAASALDPQSQYAYRLMAVVAHLGDVFSGHFVTYRRSPSSRHRGSDKWLYTSDVVVRKASLGEALSADAYMLYYEKI